MAVLKDLIVHGPSRFLSAAYYNKIKADEIEADKGKFNRLLVEDVTATNATVLGLMDVKGELHTNTWTNSNIATIDGSFYITPTIGLPDGGTASVSANSISFAGTGYSLDTIYTNEATSSTTSSVSWTVGSKILVTGEVEVNGEWMPFGTLTGLLGATSSTSVVVNTLKANRPATVSSNPETLAAIISAATEAGVSTSSLSYRNVKISMYQTNRSNNGTTYYPLGIYMSALGANGRTFIDIYGGNNAVSTTYTSAMALPVVRVGNLSSMNLPQVGGVTPNGWGIYTSNGFFSGTVAAKQGKIGSGTAIWTIGSDGNNRSYIYSGITNITTSGSTAGIYVGTNGISNYASATQYVNLTGGKITAQGADITGKITASSGLIGGWNIGTDTNKSLYYGNQTPGATTTNLILSPTSATNSNAIGGSGTGLSWFLSAGRVFGVTTAGVLYSTNAHISGSITATSFSALDSNSKERATVNTNGFIVKDVSGNTVASLSNDLTLGQVVANRYNIFIDADTGIQNRKNTSVLSQFDSTSIKFYDGAGTAATNIISQFASDGAVIGKTAGNHIVLDSSGMKVKSNSSTTIADFGSTITLGQTTGQAAVINNDGMQVYKSGTQIASFGDTITLGQTASQATVINGDGMQIYKGGVEVANFGDTITVGDSNNSNINITDNSIIGTTKQNGAIFSIIGEGATLSTTMASIHTSFLTQETTSETNVAIARFSFKDTTSNFLLYVDVVCSPNSSKYTSNYSFVYGTAGSATINSSDNIYTYISSIQYNGTNAFTVTTKSGWKGYINISVKYTITTTTPYYTFGTRSSDDEPGAFSYVLGNANQAKGNYSLACGQYCRANGHWSFSAGSRSYANGGYSAAIGSNLTAGYSYQTVIGSFNNNKSTSLFEIGNGNGSNATSNALEVDINGNLTTKGNISPAMGGGHIYKTNFTFATNATTAITGTTAEVYGDCFEVYSTNYLKVLKSGIYQVAISWMGGSNLTNTTSVKRFGIMIDDVENVAVLSRNGSWSAASGTYWVTLSVGEIVKMFGRNEAGAGNFDNVHIFLTPVWMT